MCVAGAVRWPGGDGDGGDDDDDDDDAWQLMADPGGRYFGLWQAQRAWAAEESTANGHGDDSSSSDTLRGNSSGPDSSGAPPP